VSAPLLVFTTAYRAGLPFLGAFLAGLARQDDADFELVMALDDVNEDEVAPYVATAAADLAGRTRLLRDSGHEDPVELRVAVLRGVLPGTQGVVLVDSDDVPLPGRVAAARAALASADVAACAMELLDDAGAPSGGRFEAGAFASWPELLSGCNVVGFGNAAYRSETLLAALPSEEGVRLLDWLVAVRALAAGARLAFDATPRLGYRLHRGSMAGVRRPFSAEQVQRAVPLVAGHHARLLAPRLPRHALPPTLQALVEAARDDLVAFRAQVVDDPRALRRYVTALNADGRIYRWWEWLRDWRQRIS